MDLQQLFHRVITVLVQLVHGKCTSSGSTILVFFLLVLSPGNSTAQIIIPPDNTAVTSGSVVILNCSDSSVTSNFYTWDFTAVGQGLSNIVSGCRTPPSDPTYSVESPTTTSCNLIINSATWNKLDCINVLVHHHSLQRRS